MLRTWSLRTHVALLVAVMVVAVTTIMGSLVADMSAARIVADMGRGLAQTASGLGSRLDADMTARANEIAGLGQIPGLLDPETGARVAAEMTKAEPALAWFGIMDASGTVLSASHGVLQGRNIAQRPVFQEGVKGPFLGDVHQAVLLAGLLQSYGFGHADDGGEVRFVDVSRPIVGADGHSVVGVVAAHFSWDWAGRLARAVSQDAGVSGLNMLVVGMDGTVLAGPAELVGHRVPSQFPGQERKGPDSGYGVEKWADGHDYLVGYSSHGPLGWMVLARCDLQGAAAGAAAIRREILLWGTGLAFMFSMLGWYGAGYVSRPLQAIAQAAEAMMASGRTSEGIPRVGGSTEVETLSHNLNALIAALTTQDAAIADLSRIAEQDDLTGLANRLAFDRRLEVLRASTESSPVTVMFLDLDDFKPVNDIHGHAAGDTVLRAVGARLMRCLRPGDFAARVGGDEFAVLFDRPMNSPDAQAIAARIIEAISAPVALDADKVSVGCSVGIASCPADGENLGQALEAADRALYEAKRSGKRLVRSAEERGQNAV